MDKPGTVLKGFNCPTESGRKSTWVKKMMSRQDRLTEEIKSMKEDLKSVQEKVESNQDDTI